MGAPWPDATSAPVAAPSGRTITAQDRAFWSFKPVVTPEVPKPMQPTANPIDAFVIAKLEAAGLKPAAPADKRTLIRRAAFDLTGLPPTPEEIDAFLKDDSPDAFARVRSIERQVQLFFVLVLGFEDTAARTPGGNGACEDQPDQCPRRWRRSNLHESQ
jgi:hypothetical protein